jgi:RNA polymerase sigma factor (sigma-70 family)
MPEFAEFFAASWEPCLRAVAASTGNLATAQDQTAEAFALAWSSWPKVGRHPEPRAWVVRTALHTGASWWRRRSREVRLAGADIAVVDGPASHLDAPVLAAVRRLPARQREVIALRIFLDLDIDTTAQQLDIAPGTVRAHLARAMTTLRHELAGDPNTEITS